MKSLYQSSATKICSTGSLCEKQRCHPWILVGSSLISSSNKHVCKNINQTNADTQYAETTLNEIENFQLDLPMVIENESVVQNISYSKSKVYGNRIHLLGNLAYFLAHSRSIWISCQVGGFSMAIDLGFQMKYFLNIWYLLVHPTKILLKVFSVLFKVLSTYCEWFHKYSKLFLEN